MQNFSRCRILLDREQRLDLWFTLKRKKKGGETPETAHMVTDKLNEVRGGENLPSGVAEEHNSLWPCHEGAHLQTCRQEEKGQQPGYSTWTQLSLI